jgi:hypothetical protein
MRITDAQWQEISLEFAAEMIRSLNEHGFPVPPDRPAATNFDPWILPGSDPSSDPRFGGMHVPFIRRYDPRFLPLATAMADYLFSVAEIVETDSQVQ